jgi:hypothetical protein
MTDVFHFNREEGGGYGSAHHGHRWGLHCWQATRIFAAGTYVAMITSIIRCRRLITSAFLERSRHLQDIGGLHVALVNPQSQQ